MSRNHFSIDLFQGKRVRFESQRSFDEVRESLRQLVPKTMPIEAYPGAMEKAGGLNLAAFEKIVQSQIGESGFMLFMELDHSQWLPLYGVQRKVARWILGNPLIAITIMKQDLEAGLFAPVELLISEPESREGSTVIYDLPSSQIVIRENRPLHEAARVLDGKLETLVRRATGVK